MSAEIDSRMFHVLLVEDNDADNSEGRCRYRRARSLCALTATD
jgi:hypothetical protein